MMYLFNRGVEQWSAYQAHNLRVAGSNPASAISLMRYICIHTVRTLCTYGEIMYDIALYKYEEVFISH